ncbi:MAG: tRNA (guanosine(37)-N1)-methyltransferase TrmD [Parvularculales bacterium]
MTTPSVPWTARVLTLFPECFPGSLGVSLAGQALKKGLWRLEITNIRDFATDRHRTVDGPPAGGGPGMVMRADVLGACLEATHPTDAPYAPIHLSPRGHPLTQDRIQQIANQSGITLICSRFEGVDERFLKSYDTEEISLGDFVLAGGEVATLALIEAVTRLLPEVIGNHTSLEEESFTGGLLEYPHYTRPSFWRGQKIPAVLTSGDHSAVRRWRRDCAETLTRERRPDLLKKYHGDNSKAP